MRIFITVWCFIFSSPYFLSNEVRIFPCLFKRQIEFWLQLLGSFHLPMFSQQPNGNFHRNFLISFLVPCIFSKQVEILIKISPFSPKFFHIWLEILLDLGINVVGSFPTYFWVRNFIFYFLVFGDFRTAGFPEQLCPRAGFSWRCRKAATAAWWLEKPFWEGITRR